MLLEPRLLVRTQGVGEDCSMRTPILSLRIRPFGIDHVVITMFQSIIPIESAAQLDLVKWTASVEICDRSVLTICNPTLRISVCRASDDSVIFEDWTAENIAYDGRGVKHSREAKSVVRGIVPLHRDLDGAYANDGDGIGIRHPSVGAV